MSANDKEDLLEQLDQLMKLTKPYRGPGEGFKVSVKLGNYAASAEITLPPVVAGGGRRGGGRPRPQAKAVTVEELGAGMMAYQDKIVIEEAVLQNGSKIIRITPKSFLGDEWNLVREAIQKVTVGSPKWVKKSESSTGNGHWQVNKA